VGAPSGCAGQWNVVPSPNVPFSSFLLGADALSANNMWAVGVNYDPDGVQRTLIEHWDGTQWSVVPSPNGSQENNSLNAVAAVSANDVWAVGYNFGSTLTEHWNGTSWAVVNSPSPELGNNLLIGVKAFVTNDVWAVGYSVNGSSQAHTLILHWNGSVWNIVSSPNRGTTTNILTGVHGVAANDVWAVGSSADSSSIPAQTLTLHWNG